MIKTIKKMKEDESQALIVSWCLQNNLVPVAVPNGFNLNAAMPILKKYGLPTSELAALNAKQIALLKKEGLHTGFPDLMIFGHPNILFMENKVKNNKPTQEQLMCHEWLRNLGFDVMISTDAADAIKKIRNYFEKNQLINHKYIQKRLCFKSQKK